MSVVFLNILTNDLLGYYTSAFSTISKSGERLLISATVDVASWIVTFDISQGTLKFIGSMNTGGDYFGNFYFPISYHFVVFYFPVLSDQIYIYNGEISVQVLKELGDPMAFIDISNGQQANMLSNVPYWDLNTATENFVVYTMCFSDDLLYAYVFAGTVCICYFGNC